MEPYLNMLKKKTFSAEDIPLIEDVFLLRDVMLQKVSRVLLKWWNTVDWNTVDI